MIVLRSAIRYLLCVLLATLGSYAWGVSVPLDGTRTIISGSDCALATYRFGTTADYEGQNLDLLVEVIAEDNEPVTGFNCIDVTNGVLEITLRDKDLGENIAFVDMQMTLVAEGTTTPVSVDRFVVSAFDMDRGNTADTDTDDIYFVINEQNQAYISTTSQLTVQSTSTAPYNTLIQGMNSNCDDTATTADPSCRGSVVFSQTNSALVRVQNDNAYGDDSPTSTARRAAYLSFQLTHFDDVIAGSLDHGDAPASHPDAQQPITSLRGLGDGLIADHEAAHQNSTNADADDLDGASSPANYDDEDAVLFDGQTLSGQTVFPGQTGNLEITTFGSGRLTLWIDWNRNGVFANNERVIRNVAVTGGSENNSGSGSSNIVSTTQVPLTVPATVTDGPVYARAKFTGSINPGQGVSTDPGEVEDYQFTVFSQTCDAAASADFVLSGSASLNGATNEITLTPDTGGQAGAAWLQDRISLLSPFNIEFSIYLGTKDAAGADGIAFGFQNSAAGNTAQGISGSGLGMGGITPAVAVEFDTFNNGAPNNDIANDHTSIYNPQSGALLSAVTDLGNIEDDGWHTVALNWNPVTQELEYLFDGVSMGTLNRDLISQDFAGDPNVYIGFTASTGGSSNLQKVCIENVPEQVESDYGDAPASYLNPSHIIVSGVQLGADISPDSTGYDNATANADTFDDGVTLPSILPSIDPIVVEVNGAGGYLQAWIDWNNDGDFDDADEQIATNVQDQDNDGEITISTAGVTSASTANDIIARFRWSTEQDLDPYVASTDGEVEDYAVNTRSTVTCPQGSDATGGGIASGGTGGFRESIYWLDWNCGAGRNSFQPGELIQKTWVFGDVEIRATVDNLTQQVNIYNTGSWSGDQFDDLYQGVNPVGLSNPSGVVPTFDVNWEVYMAGVRVEADIIAGDAEDTDGGETLTWETDGEPWEIFTVAPNSDLQVRFEDNDQRIVLSSLPQAGTGSLLALTENVTQTSHEINGSGVQAVAFGVFLEVDYGDIAAGYADSGGHVSRRDAVGGSKPATDTDANTLTIATLQPSVPYLGVIGPDSESSDQNSVNADADGPEEDGVTFPTLIPGSNVVIDITLSEQVPGANYVQGWIDWNQDFDFNDAGEVIALNLRDNATPDLNAADGVIELPIFVPPGAILGNTYARFRLSPSLDVPPDGLAVLGGEIEDYRVTVALENTAGILSGWVFEDNGVAGAAYDGVKDALEPGIGEQRVVLYHDADNDGVCADTDTVLAETFTDGDGAWTLVPDISHVGKAACLVAQTATGYVSVSEASGTAGGALVTGVATDDTMTLTVQPSGTNWQDILFGDAGEPLLEPDREGVLDAGNSLLYSHRFKARTTGTVDFRFDDISTTPVSPAWGESLFRDPNCSGELEAGEEALPITGVAVAPGDELCLLVSVFAPADASLEARHILSVVADQTLTGTGIVLQSFVRDVTTLTVGNLSLSKTVQNIGVDGVAGTLDDQDAGETTSNQALPGEVLRYRLRFANQGVKEMVSVTVSDATPAFSGLSAPVSCPATLPDALTGCSVTTLDGSNAQGYEGGLLWQFTGRLTPGSSGEVFYDVRVNQ